MKYLAILMLSCMCARGQYWAMDFDELWASASRTIQPVAWYKLDGDALDSSGNGYDGTWTGTEAYTNGVFAQAAYFPAVRRITLGTGNVGGVKLFAGGSDPWTVFMWLKPEGEVNRTAFSKATGAVADNLFTVLLSGTGNLSTFIRGATTVVGTATNDEWNSLAITYDGTSAKASFSGGPMISLNVGAIPDTNDPIQISGRSLTVNPWIGAIDDVRIYDRALSPANIQRIMTGQDVHATEELQ